VKLHRLELEGFGPFLRLQEVDFDAFDADGLFLISGRTGAGKSSILDGVCYALYGTAPRYGGGDRGLRSDHAEPDDPTRVRLEFTAAGRRWAITRTPEYDRPKARGEGMTTQKSSVLVEERVADEWIGRAARHREAGDLIAEIVGLDRDQFQQVILLAQNRFAEFLLAGNDDRQALLRTLFGSRRFEEYERAFDERRRAVKLAAEADAATVAMLLDNAEAIIDAHGLGGDALPDPATTTVRLAAVEQAVLRARYRADEAARLRAEAEQRHDAALEAFRALSDQRARQVERLEARAALAAQEACEPDVAATRLRIDRARAAESVRAVLKVARSATTDSAAAAEAERAARDEWLALGGRDASPTDLRAIADALTGDLARLADIAALEGELPERERAAETARGALGLASTSLTALDERVSARNRRRAEVSEVVADAHENPPAVGEAELALAAVEQRVAAARDVERLTGAARAAEAALQQASARVKDTAAALERLLRRRLDGYAGELAAGLIDGEPCAVCGSAEHPHPALREAEPVSDSDIARAQEELDRASRMLQDASAEERGARDALAAVIAAAGDASLEELEALVSEARERLDGESARARGIQEARADLHEIDQADRADAAERETLVDLLAATREAHAAAERAAIEARSRVDAARGDHESIAVRVATIRRERDVARSFADAIDDAERLAIAASTARGDLNHALTGAGFATGEEASAALLDPPDVQGLEAVVREHERTLTNAREHLRLLETELAGIADEPVSLEPAAAAVTDAREARTAALGAAARTEHVAVSLADAVTRASRAVEEAAQRSEAGEVLAALADAVAGRNDARMDLETFVLAAELEEIVEAANLRLDTMSEGRYRLQHSDAVAHRRTASGLGLSVLDAYTGQARPPQSLSGGETFLASLALALGLAEVVTARAGGVRLDTLFIDEGFGSLDEDTLELAMRTLDELRQGGRTVGLISHVAAMKEQLPAQLVVASTPQGPSIIRQGASALV
jgi:exonuclease SbcC